ncbi:MAG: nitrogenase component 1 [Lachnospiraceae bacterium]|nr:nitrogenase component 1 [Lachnospiraceae bacterium]
MKGLLKYLSPFAPDQSGAAGVLYDLGGITVICDAGGCTGNICGFDEPRWFVRKSAIFSAGLRDMDAILGRDDRLIEKLKDTAQKVDAQFAAIIGTPVPAVIATDFRALKRMGEKRCGLPVITVECTGTKLYDAGEEETYMELFRTFVDPNSQAKENAIGVIGATPLNISSVLADQKIRKALKAEGYEHVYCYGMGDGLDALKKAATVTKNLVIAPSGLKAAKYMKKTYGIPYETAYPILDEALKERLSDLGSKKVLVIHQQVLANEIRKEIRKQQDVDVTVASWFMLKKELRQPQDVILKTESGFTEYIKQENFDVILGDRYLRRALKDYQGEFIHVPHFAVSGEYEHDNGEIGI